MSVPARDRAPAPIGALDALVLAALVAYGLAFPHGGLDAMAPDDVAQTAYFSLLTRPDLVGAVGSSTPKAGLIVLLGAAHAVLVDLLQSPGAFTLLAAAFFAATVWLVARIAADLGGHGAGALALVAALGLALPTTAFAAMSSNLFFMPLVLLGLFVLARGHERRAVAILALAATTRPEGLIVIASVVAARPLLRGDWREVAVQSAIALAALVFFVLVARWVQGSWERMGAGAATGYPAFAELRTLAHLRESLGMLLGGRLVALLLLPAVFVAVARRPARVYLHFLPMVLAFVVLVGVGFIGMHYRYVATIETLVVALGCAGVFVAHDALSAPVRATVPRGALLAGAAAALALLGAGWWASADPRTPATMLVVPAVLALGARGGRLHVATLAGVAAVVGAAALLAAAGLRADLGGYAASAPPSLLDAREFLDDAVVPEGASVIADDELLNRVLVERPDHLRGARSLQSFNVAGDAARARMLAAADYLYVSKRRNRGWNYLYYFPRDDWAQDPFRLAVTEMLRTNAEQRILGARLAVIYHSPTRLVARILPDGPGPPTDESRDPR